MVLTGYVGNLVQKLCLRTELKEWQICEHASAFNWARKKHVIDCLQTSSLHITFGTFAKCKSQENSKRRQTRTSNLRFRFSILCVSSLACSLIKHRKI